MTPPPPPPVPPDLDLRDFQYMPLHVLRLRDSDFTTLATGDEFKAGVLLWCAAWHQVPAGSVPNDDRWLARQSGAGRNWRKVKAEALRGFSEHSDGRLYHRVIVEKARESWLRKMEQRVRTLKARIAAMEKRLADSKSQADRDHVTAMLEGLRQELSQTIARSVKEPVTRSVIDSVAGRAMTLVTATKGEGSDSSKGRDSSKREQSSEAKASGTYAPPRSVDDLALPAFLDRRQDADAGTSPASNIDLATIVFTEGLNWLRSKTGRSEDACRKLVGKWRKAFGNDGNLIAALGTAQREGVIDPVAWMEGAIKARRVNGSPRASWAENLP